MALLRGELKDYRRRALWLRCVAGGAGRPGHPEREERIEWMGGEFDLAHFDGDVVNAAINPALRKAQKRGWVKAEKA